MKILKILFDLLKPKISTISHGKLDQLELKEIVEPKPKNNTIHLNPKKVYYTDQTYKLPTKKQIEQFLKNDLTNWSIYRKERFDCDDFALVLLGELRRTFKGFSIGLAFSSTHAYNFFVDNKKQIWFIEPQTDKIFKTSKLHKYHSRVMII